jgi:hypothetical protein
MIEPLPNLAAVAVFLLLALRLAPSFVARVQTRSVSS